MSPIFYVPQIEGELTPTTLNKPWVQGQTSSCLFFCLIVDARRHWIYFYCVLHVVPNPASHKVPIYQRPKLWSTWFFETRCWQESLLHFSTPRSFENDHTSWERRQKGVKNDTRNARFPPDKMLRSRRIRITITTFDSLPLGNATPQTIDIDLMSVQCRSD